MLEASLTDWRSLVESSCHCVLLHSEVYLTNTLSNLSLRKSDEERWKMTAKNRSSIRFTEEQVTKLPQSSVGAWENAKYRQSVTKALIGRKKSWMLSASSRNRCKSLSFSRQSSLRPSDSLWRIRETLCYQSRMRKRNLVTTQLKRKWLTKVLTSTNFCSEHSHSWKDQTQRKGISNWSLFGQEDGQSSRQIKLKLWMTNYRLNWSRWDAT